MSNKSTLTFTFLKFAKSILKKYPIFTIPLIRLTGARIMQIAARSKNIRVKDCSSFFEFIKGNQIIRVSKQHFTYGIDIINSFDYYFSAVKPIKYFLYDLVDYSTPRYHDVIGYDRHPIFFPSFSEPLITTSQYLEFSKIEQDSVVIDLGAYSGLTSIIFKDIVGPNGIVIAVDADDQNLIAIQKNLLLYETITGNTIESLNGAVWNHNNGLEFSSEGNMGSSAANIVGNNRGLIKKVPSFTLGSIAQKFNLKNIDFIKCDVEGAEVLIFDDEMFFNKFKPRIIVETHLVENKETTDKVMNDLSKYGYTFKKIIQTGVTLPLLECYPPES